MSKRPNIVIFNPDQMRADALHHMGNEASITPNLDAFAVSEAVSFRNAFCQNPVCTPSRCSFFTGLYPHTYGQRTISHMLHDDQSSLLMELKNAGYYVWMNGRNDFLPAQKDGIFDKHANETYFGNRMRRGLGPVHPELKGELGSDSYYSFYNGPLKTDENGVNYSGDDDSVDAAIDRIRHRPEDQPLCIFLGLQFPHPPYQVEEPYFSAIDRSKLPPRIPAPEDWSGKPAILKGLYDIFNMSAWTEERWNELRACYLGMCMKVDNQFGRLCQTLKDEGIYDDTAIFFFSDHGDFTGDYGIVEKNQNTFEDCLTNIPLLIKPPKGADVDPGITDSMAELVDFYATAMDYAGIAPDHTHFGKSLREVLANRSKPNRDYVFCEGGRMENERHCTEAADIGGLNPENAYYPRISLQASYGPEHGKATMLRTKEYKYVRRYYESDELYDLNKDPRQLHNLIDQPELRGRFGFQNENARLVPGNLRHRTVQARQPVQPEDDAQYDERFHSARKVFGA
jgi:arylsulfatase A-like enzyme